MIDPTTSAKPASSTAARVSLPASDVSPSSLAQSPSVVANDDAQGGLPTPPPSDTAVPTASSQLQKEDLSGLPDDDAAPRKASLDAQRFSLDTSRSRTEHGAENVNGAGTERDGVGKASSTSLPTSDKKPNFKENEKDHKEGKEGGRVKGLVRRVKSRLSMHKNGASH